MVPQHHPTALEFTEEFKAFMVRFAMAYGVRRVAIMIIAALAGIAITYSGESI